MAFLDVVGWPKVVLTLGFIALVIGARVLFPEETEWFKTTTLEIAAGVVAIFRDLGG